jgi:hypothetical protein
VCIVLERLIAQSPDEAAGGGPLVPAATRPDIDNVNIQGNVSSVNIDPGHAHRVQAQASLQIIGEAVSPR